MLTQACSLVLDHGLTQVLSQKDALDKWASVKAVLEKKHMSY